MYCQTCGKPIDGKPVKRTVWDILNHKPIDIIECRKCRPPLKLSDKFITIDISND